MKTKCEFSPTIGLYIFHFTNTFRRFKKWSYLHTPPSNATEMQPCTTPHSPASHPAPPPSLTTLMLVVFAVDWEEWLVFAVPLRETPLAHSWHPTCLWRHCEGTDAVPVPRDVPGLRIPPTAPEPRAVCRAARSRQRSTAVRSPADASSGTAVKWLCSSSHQSTVKMQF